MTEIDLEMEAGAKAATQGPWRRGQEGNLSVYGPDAAGESSGLIARVYEGGVNATHIANCSPPNILALIERVRKAENSLAASQALLKEAGERLVQSAEIHAIEPWRKIDPTKRSTWPAYVSAVWLFHRNGGSAEFKAFWFPHFAVSYTHWKPAHIPEPPANNS